MSILNLAQQAIAKDKARAQSKIAYNAKANCARNRAKTREERLKRE